jgi:hypothetical protein
LLNLAQARQDRRHELSAAVVDGHLPMLPKSSSFGAFSRNPATDKNFFDDAPRHS